MRSTLSIDLCADAEWWDVLCWPWAYHEAIWIGFLSVPSLLVFRLLGLLPGMTVLAISLIAGVYLDVVRPLSALAIILFTFLILGVPRHLVLRRTQPSLSPIGDKLPE